MEYLDFDLHIEQREDHYRARVIDSPAGQAAGEFTLPFSPLELENFFLRIGQPRQVRRQVRLGTPAYENIVQEFGGRLYQAVFNDDMRAALSSSLEAARKERKGLRLRLRLSEAPDLADLPWEYLYNPALNRFLALSVQTSLVRYLDLPERIAPLPVQPPLRMLVMISNPSDTQVLDVEQEWTHLKSALRGLEERGALIVDRLPDGRLATLQRQLRRHEYHILHYVGHAGYDPQAQDGVLLLADDEGRGRLVSGAHLGVMLHDAPTLRLVVLNACEGARTSRTDPFAGVAQSVVQQGIPAVVAMQFEITDEAAITFAREFYSALVDAYPVDAALAEARKGILSQGNELEWGTPVLYMRTPEGVLFALDTATRARPVESASVVPAEPEAPAADDDARVQRLYADALGAYWLEDWDRAARLFRQVLDARPAFRDAASRLAETERQTRLSALYAEAQAGRQAQDDPRAERALEELAAQQPDYRDVAALLAETRQRRELASLYAEARQLHEAAQWQAVLHVLARIRSLAPDYPDPQGLEAAAQSELARAEREEQLDSLYTRAQLALGEGKLAEAQALLGQVRALDPAYRESEILLARVEKQMAAATARPPAEERAPRDAAQRHEEMRQPSPAEAAAQQEPPPLEQAAPRGAKRSPEEQPGRAVPDEALAPSAAPGPLGALAARAPLWRGKILWLAALGALVLAVAVWVAIRAAIASQDTSSQSQDRLVLDLAPDVTMELVAVPEGEFLMGTNTGAGQPGESNEAPQHTVYLDEYLIGQYEVTVEQFAAFVRATGYRTTAERQGWGYVWYGNAWAETPGADWRHPNGPASEAPSQHPVTQVSWDDAAAFAAWAGQVTERSVRLPTEAEWEKAARGEDGRTYPWGNDWQSGHANIDETGLGGPADVGSYGDGVSPYGVEDMAGNVWEWVQDWYGETYYQDPPSSNPPGPADGQVRVVRGGSWYDNTWSARSALRYYYDASLAYAKLGFRVVLDPGPG